MGRGYTRIIGVKKFWLITALLGLEIVNLQVLVDFLGSGLSAALSVLWIFVVVVIVGANIEDIMNILSCQNETQRFEPLLILIHVFSPSIQTHENFMNFLKE
jgi:hypothetical protein